MPTQRSEERRVGERASTGYGSSFICLFLPPWPALCKLGWPGVLLVLPEVPTPVVTPVLGPSFVLFLRASPFLVF